MFCATKQKSLSSDCQCFFKKKVHTTSLIYKLVAHKHGMWKIISQCGNPIIWNEIAKLFFSKDSKPLWDRILDFATKYRKENNCQWGCNWARIIDDNYLRNLGVKENFVLASIFGGIISSGKKWRSLGFLLVQR